MTSPYDDELTSQFEVEINFRPDSVRSLDEVTDLLSRARVESEALSRASSDVVEHLREAATSEPINLLGQDQGGIAFSPGSFGGGDRIPPLEGVSGGDRSPSNRDVGVGAESGSESLEDRIDPARNGPSEREVTSRLGDLEERDPERVENLRAARGLGGKGTPRREESGFAQGIEGFSDLTQSILSETRPGQSISGTLGNLAGGLGGVGGNSGLAGLLGGKGLGALGIAGGAITAGLAANAAVQAGGAQIQQYRNMGSVQGGGAGEGVSHEMAIRTMAMNPFLNTEQSRQIVMTALSEGYTGKEFDTVTDFMAENLKEMNMSVAQSTEILRKNVDEGGQSIQQLSLDMQMLKSTTDGGVMSLQERTQIYQQTTGQLIDMGISGDQASSQALASMELFEDNRQLSGVMAGIISNPSDALAMQAGTSAGYRGRNAYQMRQMMGNAGTLPDDVYNLIWRIANDIEARGGHDDYDKKMMFNQQLSLIGIPMEPNDSDALYDELIQEGAQNRMTEAREGAENEMYGVQEESVGGFQGRVNETGAFMGVLGQAVGDTLGMLNFGIGVKDETLWSNFSEAYSSTGQAFQGWSNERAKTGTDGEIAMLTALNEEYGANNIQLVDDDGRFYNQQVGISEEDMERISSGEIKVKVNGRDPVAIQEARAIADEGGFDDTGDGRLSSNRTEVSVSPTPELERLLRFNVRTPNQLQADSGWGTSAHNNPPPGDDR